MRPPRLPPVKPGAIIVAMTSLVNVAPSPASPPRSCCDIPALIRGVVDDGCAFEELVSRLMPLIGGADPIPAEIQLELSTALLEIERRAEREDRLYALVADSGGASIALGESGQVLAINASGAARFGAAVGDGLSSLGISRESFKAFERRLASHKGPTLIQTRAAASRGDGAPSVLAGSYYPRFRAFILSEIGGSWPQSVDLAMAEIFGLSLSEREVLAGLAKGLDAAAIAQERGSALGTVRQQIKTVTAKLGLRSRAAAAAFAASAAGLGEGAERVSGGASGALPTRGREAPLRAYAFDRDGRRVGYRRFGREGGKPVLFFHGPSFGAGEYSEDRILADRRGLAVYAIERPGYGRTDPASEAEGAAECEHKDALALVRRESLGRFYILAHEAGLIPALDFARREADRPLGILAVSSSPPFIQLEQIDAIPAHQGIYIHAARRAPWLARLFLRLLAVRMRRLGPQAWPEVIFKGQDFESAVMARASLTSGVIGSYSFYLNQAGAGFEHDLRLMLGDWGSWLQEARIPLSLLHGARNQTTTPAQLEIFKTLRPDVRVEIVPDAGLTLAVSHPRLVYQRLAELAAATDRGA